MKRDKVMKTKTQHTPGPWKVDSGEIYGPSTLLNGEKYADMIARIPVECRDGEIITREDEANARLIAAAPELLETLEQCVTVEGAACFRSIKDMARRLNAINWIAKEAISKAKGEA